MTILIALLAALAISAVSLIGLVFLFPKEELHGRKMHLLLALAAGAMLGNALLHMVPHSLTLEQQAVEANRPPAILKLFDGHDHGSHQGHDHSADAKPEAHDHDAHDEHAGHDHAAHEEHDEHAGHDHDAHAGHDHDAHAGHDHDAHDGHDHDAHAGHDHDAHAGHDHDAHDAHDHDADKTTPAAPVGGDTKVDPHDAHGHAGHGHAGMFTCVMLLLGMLGFYAFDLLLQRDSSEGTKGVASEGYMVIAADMVENLMDGIVVGTAFAISIPVGIAAAITIILHEVPLELGDYAVLRHAGFSRRRALTINFVSGLASVAGVAIALVLGLTLSNFALYVTPLAAGGFLYIAGSILVPRLRSQCCDNHHWQYLLVSMIGVLVMVAILFFE